MNNTSRSLRAFWSMLGGAIFVFLSLSSWADTGDEGPPYALPSESGASQPFVEPDNTVIDGAPLRETILNRLSDGDYEGVESAMNASFAEEILAALNTDATGAILPHFAEMPPSGKRIAAWVLSKSPQREVSSELAMRLCFERDDDVRDSLVLALACRMDDEAGSGLRTALAQDPSECVRAQAAHALGSRIALDRETGPSLGQALEADASDVVRAACATALGSCPCEESARALFYALGSPSVDVRLAAAAALGHQESFADPDTLAAFEATEQDPQVSAALAQARWGLSRESVYDTLSECADADGEPPIDEGR